MLVDAVPLGGGAGGEGSVGGSSGESSSYQRDRYYGENRGLDGPGFGTIIGIIVGVMAGLVLLKVIIYKCQKCRHTSTEEGEESTRVTGRREDAFNSEYQRGVSFCQSNPVCREYPMIESREDFTFLGCREIIPINSNRDPPPYTAPSNIPVALDILMYKEKGGKEILLESMVRRGTQKCVLANQPLDRTKEFHSFLFDIEELPASGSVIALGLCAKPYPTFRLPGWHRESFGVHSDDGAKFFSDSFGGVDYCQPFKRGDRISVNYVRSTGKIFLSLNGTKLPDAYEHKFHRLERFPVYLCVGFDGPSKVRLTLDADIVDEEDIT